MQPNRKISFAMGAVVALVLGSGTAYAATGGKFILGMSNSAGKTTILTNPNGTALQLKSKAGTPSIRVSNTAKVPSLNSDLLDGLDSTKFALAAGAVSTVSLENGGFYIDFDENGTQDAVAGVATCPPGTKLTGGGGTDWTPGGTFWWNAPIQGGQWVVVSSWTPDTAAFPDPSTLISVSAQCYNPRGSVPGASFRSAPDAASREAVAAALSRKFNH